jgi:hypothetical protein
MSQLVLECRRAELYRLHRICQRRGQRPNQSKGKRAHHGFLWSATADITGLGSLYGCRLRGNRVFSELVK